MRITRRLAFTTCTGVALVAALGFGGPAEAKSRSPQWADSLRHVTVLGAELAYLDVGKGEPVVLVHGIASDYRMWLGQIDALSKHHRVIAYSRRYHYPNHSPERTATYSVSLHARDLEALIHALNLSPVTLVGQSYGATVAALVAIEHPELVRSLVLAEPILPDLMAGTSQASRYESERTLNLEQTRMALRGDFNELSLERVVEWYFGVDRLDMIPAEARQRMADNSDALRLQYLSPSKSPKIGCESVASIHCPVLYLEGGKSPWHAHAMADAFLQCRPATRRVVLTRVTHGLAWQDPKSFNKAAINFLERGELASE